MQAQLVSQNSASPVGKAGIALANDLTAPEKGGYAVLVHDRRATDRSSCPTATATGSSTPGRAVGSTYHPAYLKLTRDGATYTAYASKTARPGRQVGTAQVPSATGTGDAGMVASAANANYPGKNIEAIFSGFSVTS